MTGNYEAYALCAGTRTVDWSTRMYLHPIGENRDLRLFHVGAQGAGRADRRRYRVHPPARPCQGASVAGFRTREELLHAAGLDATRVANVILTHLHSDHFDVEGIFPGAVFSVQRTELDFWRVCCARERWHQPFVSDCFAEDLARCSPAAGCGSSTELEDVVDGVSLELVGGHSPGIQIVVVRSRRRSAVSW